MIGERRQSPLNYGVGRHFGETGLTLLTGSVYLYDEDTGLIIFFNLAKSHSFLLSPFDSFVLI